jgi:hypothetical protein
MRIADEKEYRFPNLQCCQFPVYQRLSPTESPGFLAEHVLAISFDFTSGPFRGPGNQQPYFHDLVERVTALPGVRMAGAISEPPLARRRAPDQPISVEGQPLRVAADCSPVAVLRP